MSTLSIRVHFPLGVYTGHRADGSPDPFPDIARLHSALMHSAGTGLCAVEDNGFLVPDEKSLRALRWLENHPPTGMLLPERRPQGSDTSRFIYRKEGTVNTKKSTNQRRVSDGMSLNGPVGYRWESVPDEVADTVRELCADIAVLGEKESTVVIDHRDFEPNLLLDTTSSLFTPGGHGIRSAGKGRTDALTTAYARANPRKFRPQKTTASEEPLPSAVPTGGLCSLRYVRPEPPVPDVPWDRVLILELSGPRIPENQRLDWCVTLHRTLIASIGTDVPSLVTGVYPSGSANRPANQLSIQYLPAPHVERHGTSGESLALLIPRDAAAEDLVRLAEGLSSIRNLHNRHGSRSVRFNGVSVSGDSFWPEPVEGFRRLWSPTPLAVTETRSPKPSRTAGRRWGLADAGVISVAHVWRGEFDVSGASYDERLVRLHEAATARGVRVGSARLRPVNTTRYVHKSRKGNVPQCWTGLVDLGTLAPPTAVVAVGQSRHLGGGLLEPVDVPDALYDTLMGVTHE